MKLRKSLLLFGFIVTTALTTQMWAQVTVGSAETPVPGALLQLKDGNYGDGTNAKKGLGMPRVELSDLNKLKMGTAEEFTDSESLTAHIGLLVYNVTKIETAEKRICPGLHVWIGSEWQPLKPYPVWEPRTSGSGEVMEEFVYLDPSNTSDPNYHLWAAMGKDPTNYQLGSLGKFTDTRDNIEYYHTRFYVGARMTNDGSGTEISYSCDPNNPVWVPAGTPTYEFREGVWMSENLRATIVDPTRDKVGEPVVSIVDGKKGDLAYGAYQIGYYSPLGTNGRFYSWGAATNGKNINGSGYGPDVAVSEGGLNAGEQIQGICPSGWHLPSDKEWTDLVNGIIFKITLFSNEPGLTDNPNGPFISYAEDADHNASGLAPFGRAMRVEYEDDVPPPLGRMATRALANGYTKTAAQGGFTDPMAMSMDAIDRMIGPDNPEPYGSFWTSSVAPVVDESGVKKYKAWVRNSDIDISGIERKMDMATDTGTNQTHYLRSVRCMRNNN